MRSRDFKSVPNSVTIEMTEDPPQVLQQKVRSGDRHLGIGSFPHKEKGLSYEPLYIETHSLYCSSRHRFFAMTDSAIDPRDVRSERIVSRGYWRQEFVLNLGFENIGALVYQIEPQLILILSGEFLGFLPDHYARQWVASGHIRALLPSKISYRCAFDLVTKKASSPSRMVTAFLKSVREAHGVTN